VKAKQISFNFDSCINLVDNTIEYSDHLLKKVIPFLQKASFIANKLN